MNKYCRHRISLLLFFTFFIIANSFSQTPAIDSLTKVLKELNSEQRSFAADTAKINTLNLISSAYINRGDLEKGDSLAGEALSLAERRLTSTDANDLYPVKRGMAKSYRNIGNVCFYRENNPGALSSYAKEMEIYQKLIDDSKQKGQEKEIIKNSTDLSRTLRNSGNVYVRQAKYPEALDLYLKSLKLAEELKDEKSMGLTYGNMGIVYDKMRDYDKALACYKIGRAHV